MSSFNPFISNNNNNTSVFGNINNNTQNPFKTNNNNTTTSTLFGNSNNISFGANNNISNNNNFASPFLSTNNTINNNTNFGNTSNNQNNIFLNNNQNNKSINNNQNIFGNNNQNIFTNNNQNNIFINNNQNNIFTNNNQNNIFSNNNQNNNIFQGQNNNNNNQNNIISNNTFNLRGINDNSNNNINNILNNNNNQQYNNSSSDANNQILNKDLNEYKQVLLDVNKCIDPSKNENMFKDYLYKRLPEGKSINDVNIYRPYTFGKNQQISNDYNIWSEGNKNNKNPNELYPVQISSPGDLLKRNKFLEKGILKTIANDHDSLKNLENLNKKIRDEMNHKLMDLKDYQCKVEELEFNLATLKDKYNYITGSAIENIEGIREIKNNEKKIKERIKENKIDELLEEMKKSSHLNMNLNNQNYIKDMSQDKIIMLLDGFTEIQNIMNHIYNDNIKTLNIVMGAQKKFDEICEKHNINLKI